MSAENLQYCFRAAKHKDLDAIMKIMEQAKAHMRREGRDQWHEHYPTISHIVSDIERGYGYVFASEFGILAYGAVVFDGEPAYGDLDGRWLSEDCPYVVVHRLAVADSYKGKGLAMAFLKAVFGHACGRVGSMRIDTRSDNLYMLRIFDRLGFSYCGKVVYENGERLAFEKLL